MWDLNSALLLYIMIAPAVATALAARPVPAVPVISAQ